MKKFKSSFLILIIFIILGFLLTLLYIQSKPVAQTAREPIVENDVNFLNFEEELFQEDGDYFLWFCDSSDDNCNYVKKEYVNNMLLELNIEEFEGLIEIDFVECPFSKSRLSNKYNVENMLAFVKVSVKDQEITYSDSLSWDDTQPFTYDELKNWLYKHNIWQKNYSKKSN